MKSKRKKRQDDFQKIKLKVGKKKPKADNATNTNFRSKGIHLSEQLKRDSGPTTHRQLGINVSALTSPVVVPIHFCGAFSHNALHVWFALVSKYISLSM